MAPTAILASQHLESFNEILAKYGIKCELLIGSVSKKKKEEMLEKLKNYFPDCYICNLDGKVIRK